MKVKVLTTNLPDLLKHSNSGTNCAKPNDFVYSLSLKQEQLAADWLSLGVARLSQTCHTTNRNVEVLSFFPRPL